MRSGITMLTLIVTIMLMIIITGMISVRSHTSLQLSNLTRLQNDIEALNDRVAVYCVEHNGALPKMEGDSYKISKTTLKSKFDELKKKLKAESDDLNKNDNDNYYTIDIDLLENLTLNYGEGYKSSTSDDRYIINEKTHQIYYIQGIAYDGILYHTAES